MSDGRERARPAEREPLSPSGRVRRAAMLRALKAEVGRRRRRRRALRAGAAALALGAAVLAAALRVPRETPPPDLPGGGDARMAGPPAAAGPVPGAEPRVEVVHDDPGVLERIRAGGAPDPSIWIGDDELLALLREAGRSCGLVRTGGAVYLTRGGDGSARAGAPRGRS